MLSVTKDSFQKEVIKHKGVVFVDFYADWCGPCRMTAPIIEELSKELKKVKFVKVNVDQNQELASSYSIFSIPSFLIFNNGQIVSQFTGAMSKERLLEEINKVINR